jgi:hypothetical protein
VDIFNKITKLYYDLYNDDKIKKIIPIDGTYYIFKGNLMEDILKNYT